MISHGALDELLAECHEDFVGLWEVVRMVRRELGPVSGEQVRRVTMPLLRVLLEEYDVVAGFPHHTGVSFLPWDVLPKLALDRIDFGWATLGRDPDIGEVVWLTSPELID